MDVEELQRLVNEGESFTTEFKSDRAGFNDKDLIEAVVCLANGAGGVLLVGVEDRGEITGARPRHGSVTDPFRLQAYISNVTNPPVSVVVDVLRVDAVDVIAVDVPDAPTVVGTSAGLYVRRAIRMDGLPECIPFPAHEMLASRIERGEVDYAAIVEPSARLDELDPLEFERFRRLVARTSATSDQALAGLSDVEIGRSLGVIAIDREELTITRGAILLFGYAESIRKFVPSHETAFQVMSGQSVVVNEFTTNPLIATAESLYARVQAQNRETELDAGLIRIAIPRIPPMAAREIIANALVHRDYTRLGPVRVIISDDVLEIVSPGGFPRGVTLANFLDSSQPRSRILAEAFLRAGLVERTGRGINRVFESVLRTGREQPDYSRSNNDQVVASIAIDDSDVNLVRFLVSHEESTGRRLALADLQVLHALRHESKISASELSSVLQKSEIQAKATLSRLVESGLVESRGDGRARRYSLSAASYRALVEPSAYVRVRPFDALQQEQMVLTYITSNGRITRREVAELCGLAPTQARKLLKELTTAGKLALRGERRGAFYVPNDAELDNLDQHQL